MRTSLLISSFFLSPFGRSYRSSGCGTGFFHVLFVELELGRWIRRKFLSNLYNNHALYNYFLLVLYSVDDDSDSDNSKKRTAQQISPVSNRQPQSPSNQQQQQQQQPAGAVSNMSRFRGRFPTMSLHSSFKAFDDESFAKAQRKNRKMNAFVKDGQSDERFDIMNKMVREFIQEPHNYSDLHMLIINNHSLA